MKKKTKITRGVMLLVPFLLMMICLLSALYMPAQYQQARVPLPVPQGISGEYSLDGLHWEPLTSESDISARHGVLYIRGHLRVDLPEGTTLRFYKDHIGVSIKINGQLWSEDLINQVVQSGKMPIAPSSCGTIWESLVSPGITTQDEIEVMLYNPHTFGNDNAFRSFLSTMCNTMPESEIIVERRLQGYSLVQRFLGVVFLAAALLFLEFVVSSIIMGVRKNSVHNLKTVFLLFFAGGYFLYDTIDVSLWSRNVTLNTYIPQLCMMMMIFCCGEVVLDGMTGFRRMAGRIVMTASALVNCACFVYSALGRAVIYDTYPVWFASQLAVCPLMIVLCLLELFSSKGYRLQLLSGVLIFGTLLLDFAGVGRTLIRSNVCSKTMLTVLVVLHVIFAAKRMAESNREFIHAKKLEAELEDSRIAIMLSQIKPHFVYNVLNTIYHLYRRSPETAQHAVSTFADYLRCNMLSIEKTGLIHFSEERRHIEAYLSLEQIRFEDELHVIYDIQAENFRLPPLTVQPLVENAVKHGVTKKRGGGTVRLSTRETPDSFVITIADDGQGFDPDRTADDGQRHVGIRNVRRRLESMMGGTLEINSSKEGTTVVVTLPRKEAGMSHEDHCG